MNHKRNIYNISKRILFLFLPGALIINGLIYLNYAEKKSSILSYNRNLDFYDLILKKDEIARDILNKTSQFLQDRETSTNTPPDEIRISDFDNTVVKFEILNNEEEVKNSFSIAQDSIISSIDKLFLPNLSKTYIISGKSKQWYYVNDDGDVTKGNSPLKKVETSKLLSRFLKTTADQFITSDGLVTFDRIAPFGDLYLRTPTQSILTMDNREFKITHPDWIILNFAPTEILLSELKDSKKELALISFVITFATLIFFIFYIRTKVNEEVAVLELFHQREVAVEKSKLATMGEVAAGIAHEINNPVAAVITQLEEAEYALDEKASTEEVMHFLKVSKDQVMRIGNIVRGIKNLSRNADNDPLETANIKDLLPDIMPIVSKKLLENDIQLFFPEDIPNIHIQCRPTQISQVLINLINNARDALVENDNIQDKWIRVDIYTKNRLLNIAVSDAGTGILEEVKESLFKPFFTTKVAGKGTGIGLSLSKRIMSEHNGDLYIDDHSPNTTFIMELAVYEPTELEDNLLLS